MLRGVHVSGHRLHEPGLRERKRLETRHALESAALDLVVESGLIGVTVDQVVERANLSRRTFFNYFGSLSDALIGKSKLDPNPDLVALLRAMPPGATVFEDMKRLVLELTRLTDLQNQLLMRRIKVLSANPQLFLENLTQFADLFEAISGEVSRRLAEERGTKRSSRTDAQARLLFHVCAAVLRHGIEQFVRDPHQADLNSSIEHAFSTFDDLKEQYL
jgi:AcrR family transcriptional regulator